MKFLNVLLGLLLVVISLTLAFSWLDSEVLGFNVMILVLLVLGVIFFILGLKKTRKFNPLFPLTAMPGRKWSMIIMGVILVLISLSLMFFPFGFDILGIDVTLLIVLVLGLLVILFGFLGKGRAKPVQF